MTTLSILYDRMRWEEKELSEKAAELGISVKVVDAKVLKLDSHIDATLQDIFGDVALQRCISYFRGLHLSVYLESAGQPIVNSYGTANICGNKVMTTLALRKAGVPTPRTVISFTADAALESAEILGYPIVLKPVVGSWGRMVVPLRNRETAAGMVEMREQMNGLMSQIYYIQEMVDKPDRDIRGIVVGDQIVSVNYRYAPPGEWRTNVARGGRSEPCPLNKELEEIILKASEAVGGGILGIDCMESKDGYVVHEVNNTVEFRGAASVSQNDIAKAMVQYTVSQVKR
jgi:[lysine-biosynthesis-protein LysW]--L-2-aminoadipate ligase